MKINLTGKSHSGYRQHWSTSLRYESVAAAGYVGLCFAHEFVGGGSLGVVNLAAGELFVPLSHLGIRGIWFNSNADFPDEEAVIDMGIPLLEEPAITMTWRNLLLRKR